MALADGIQAGMFPEMVSSLLLFFHRLHLIPGLPQQVDYTVISRQMTGSVSLENI